MMTRRDKLLNRPWQLRRYNNHRKKVLTALPAIDFGPPAERHHVTHKLKKLQWEGERRLKIEEDNFKLLQRMGAIMKKNRLENFWETPPPDFLHRVGIYHQTRSPTPYEELSEEAAETPEPPKRRNCVACSPPNAKTVNIPEERVPWAPPKPRFSRRSSSTPRIRSDFDHWTNEKLTLSNKQRFCDTYCEPRELPKLPQRQRAKSVDKISGRNMSSNRLVVTQGSLKLSVNFPPYAEVKVVAGKENKFIQRAKCECTAIKQHSIS